MVGLIKAENVEIEDEAAYRAALEAQAKRKGECLALFCQTHRVGSENPFACHMGRHNWYLGRQPECTIT